MSNCTALDLPQETVNSSYLYKSFFSSESSLATNISVYVYLRLDCTYLDTVVFSVFAKRFTAFQALFKTCAPCGGKVAL